MSKPVGEQGSHTKRPSSSRDENNRRQGQDFLGHPFSRKAVVPIISEIPRDKRVTRDKNSPTKPPDERTTTRHIRNSDGETRAARSDKQIDGTPKIGSLETVRIGRRLRSQHKQISKVLEYAL